MSVTAAMVKELRERTGAGMMECKKALVEVGGDVDAAIEAMRKSGQAKADKKANRTAAEGLVFSLCSEDGKKAIIIEVNCETDFVARDENFVNFVNEVAQLALNNTIHDIEALNAQQLPSGKTVDETRTDLITKIGENVKLRRLEILETEGSIGSYIHGGRIGVLVALDKENADVAKDLAMHVAANSPIVISNDEVPEALIAKEREIFSAQAENSGKPADIIEKMIDGRIRKFLDEVSLEGQPFVKDPNIKVVKLLSDKQIKVVKFVRYEVGEGIEKESVNFADEVMAQVKGN